MAPTELRLSQLGGLQDLLLKACPPHKRVGPRKYEPDANGFKSIAILAHTLNMSAWGVQRWIHEGKVPAKRVTEIVKNNPEAVSQEDFIKYVF